MSKQPTNGELLEKINFIHVSMGKIEEHLEKQNGSIGKLRTFKDKVLGGAFVLACILSVYGFKIFF